MFQITQFTLSDRIYPIEYTYIRIEDILWPRQILRVVKVRARWWGKQPCSFIFRDVSATCYDVNCFEICSITVFSINCMEIKFDFSEKSLTHRMNMTSISIYNDFLHISVIHNDNIVAAFWGMHVSPAKHSYAWLPRKCDYRTDRHTDRRTDRQTTQKVIPMCRYAWQTTR